MLADSLAPNIKILLIVLFVCLFHFGFYLLGEKIVLSVQGQAIFPITKERREKVTFVM